MPVRGQPGRARAWTEERTGVFPLTPDLCLSAQPGLPACPPPSPLPAPASRCPLTPLLSLEPPEQGRLTTRLLHLPSHLTWVTARVTAWAQLHRAQRPPSCGGHIRVAPACEGPSTEAGHGANEAGKDPASICHSLSCRRGADGGDQSAGGRAFRPCSCLAGTGAEPAAASSPHTESGREKIRAQGLVSGAAVVTPL